MASDVKKKPSGARVKDVVVPGSAGSRMIEELAAELRKALGMATKGKKKE